jgi:alanine racemase
MRPTRVEIDLSAIRHNLQKIRKFTGRKIMMAIKADAYGHGAPEVGRLAQEHALVDMFGVTSLEEGIDLRQAGIRLPILIFTLIDPSQEDIDTLCEHNLIPTMADTILVDALVKGARRWNRPIDVHFKTDTGMGRLGFPPEESLAVINSISSIREIRITGIYTHFPISDQKDKTFTRQQIHLFQQMLDKAHMLGRELGLRHCANSGAILDHPDSHMDIVRPGILCYGLYPSKESTRNLDIQPAMTMKSGIMFIKRVKKGTSLSYGLTYTTERDTYIATIPVGYADGYPRALSNKAKVIINGKTYPIVGRICMDQCLIELGNDIYPIGQEVTLFGTHTITAQDVADWCDTIPYEITCNMSRRVPRMYL